MMLGGVRQNLNSRKQGLTWCGDGMAGRWLGCFGAEVYGWLDCVLVREWALCRECGYRVLCDTW